MIETFEKRPQEVRVYDMDFSPQPECDPNDGDESLTGVPVVTCDTPEAKPDLDPPSALVIGTPAVSGKRAQVQISGGTHGYSYLVKFLVTTTGGKTLKDAGRLKIVEPQA